MKVIAAISTLVLTEKQRKMIDNYESSRQNLARQNPQATEGTLVHQISLGTEVGLGAKFN